MEVLLGEFWDPSSGAVFAEEGDQQRFWKLTRRFVEGLGEEGSPHAGRIKAVRALINNVVAIRCIFRIVAWGSEIFALRQTNAGT